MQKKVLDINGNPVVLVEEKEYRKRLLQEARFKGCEIELRLIFEKYDKMIKNCGNPKEREAIGTLGVLEVSSLLDSKDVGKGGALVINGKKVIEG